jgi:peptidoglycan/xylan/chitin deacetylase (PgdA/CDA1 family)
MPMLKELKKLALFTAESLGISKLVLDSPWRGQRLLILCYHGFAMADEYLWNPALYMRPAAVFRRLQILRDSKCEILPLAEAIRLLYAGALPPRSVAITVDDGTYDFHSAGLPLFREFRYPVTVYLSTYYSEFNRPVFDPAISYLLWKARGQTLDWPGVLEAPVRLDSAAGNLVQRAALDHARRQELSGRGKDELLADLATRIGVDYEAFCARRMFTLMTPDEVREAAASGADIQLHTHRHRVYKEKAKFLNELDENRVRIEAWTGSPARHFCYPSGYYTQEFVPWLRQWGAESGVTCGAGIAAHDTEAMLLPRLTERESLSELEFRAWISGIAAFLPRRRRELDDWPVR